MDRIPPELSARILSFCGPSDLASFSQASVGSRNHVYGTEDQYIWREVFLNTFDEPRRDAIGHPQLQDQNGSFNWREELQKRIRAGWKLDDLGILVRVLLEASPDDGTGEESKNARWVDRVLRESKVLGNDTTVNGARLRAYVSLTHEQGEEDERERVLEKMRIKSRCLVYDLRNYFPPNGWWPLDNEKEIDWVHLEHMANVVMMNLREIQTLWRLRRPPIGLENVRPFWGRGEDWAGVEGTWRRYVCFMDYRDLFTFNFPAGRSPGFFQDKRFREATRLIEVKLKLASKDRLKHPTLVPPHANGTEQYPTLYFHGTSKGATGNEATLEGCVWVSAKDSSVRWWFTTIHGDGAQTWCSQGVQMGCMGSKAGVVGNWGTVEHEMGDPVGTVCPFFLVRGG
ncbi:hypothetical protein E1B28_005046 [Marasmius oreades]|uniref:F-box domain-containing protein n=1 Tax=Marasmius oreades TaxID=181124 RepID=A0A9P7UZZ1_9AGAR|nr:uncharacterized protein E1B28_005046 [Marasmius oreades]KAG7097726.1 hypothetical protein E1B28_005046 [Marasmius oreades]